MAVHPLPPPTGSEAEVSRILSGLSISFFFFLMLGLGCSIQFKSFKDKLRHPRAVFVGMSCQFIFMPFITWLCAVSVGLDSYSAAALCIVGTCPGGALSNMLAYVIKADLTLSVAMTTASSAAAFVMIPTNLKLYLDVLGVGEGTRLTLDDLNIEWSSILLSTGIVVVGTVCGMTVRAKATRFGPKAEKFGMFCGIGTFAVTFYQNRQSGAKFSDIDASLMLAVTIPTVSGMVIGILLSRMCKLSKPSSVAVGIESSLQNGVLALAIVQLSIGSSTPTEVTPSGSKMNTTSNFTITDDVNRGKAILVPIMYTMVSSTFNICAGLLLWKLGWTGACPKARPLRDFHKDWKETGSIRKAVSMSQDRLRSMHIESNHSKENTEDDEVDWDDGDPVESTHSLPSKPYVGSQNSGKVSPRSLFTNNAQVSPHGDPRRLSGDAPLYALESVAISSPRNDRTGSSGRSRDGPGNRTVGVRGIRLPPINKE